MDFQASHDVWISKNKIRNCWAGGESAIGRGVNIQASADLVTVDDNYIVDDRATPLMAYAISQSGTNVRIRRNTSLGSVTAPVSSYTGVLRETQSVEVHVYMAEGEIKAGTMPAFWVPVAEGEEVRIVKARYMLAEGTSILCELKKNGTGITGFTALEAKSTEARQVTPTPVTFADNDEVTLVKSSATGEPRTLSFEIVLERRV